MTVEETIKNSPQGILISGISNDAARAAQEKIDAAPVSAAIGWLLNGIGDVIAGFLGIIASIAGGIFTTAVDQILKVTDMPKVVDVGWTIIRDICNMFFILIMVVIGLGIILRIKEYQEYGHLIRNLVIMAILVNFSKVIAVTIMNAVNFLAAAFYSGGLGTNVFSFLWTIVNPVNDATAIFQNGWQAGLMTGLGKIVFMAIATVVLVALAGMFIIRLVGLYVLIIFSPIAYVARILPATEKFSEEWWSHFLKYLIWAPVALFMIQLTIMTVNSIDAIPGGNDSSFYYFIICAFLAAALLVAEEAGMVGSKAVMGAVEKGAHWAGEKVAGYASRKWNDYTSHKYGEAEARAAAQGKEVGLGTKALFLAANPIAGYKAWSERAQEKEHIASGYAQATAKEIFGGAIGTPFRENLARKEEVKYADEYSDMSKEEKAVAARNLFGAKGHEAAVRRRALMRAAVEDNHIEDILASPQFVEEYTDDEGDLSSEAKFRFLNDFLGADHDAESQRFIASDLNTLGAKAKRFDYTGMATVDPETGAYKKAFKDSGRTKVVNGKTIRILEDDGQAAYAANELSKLEAQDRAKLSPQNFVTIRTEVSTDAAGKKVVDQKFVYKADAYGRAAIKHLDEAVRANISRTQSRTIGAFIPGTVDDNGVIEVDTIGEMQAIKDFWEANNEHARVLYAKKRGFAKPLEEAEKIDGVTVRLKGDTAILRNPDGSTQRKRVAPETIVNPKKNRTKSVNVTSSEDESVASND
ncbi:MAG: hypothetical protein A2660_01490 [Candidatus Doudnabacteria bacterium RIFCSPHIGHO2_01_FULL_45_18]|uniref:Uncharacterized protein n=1 Tax=Candidatus Doudnabacteria bacterium RIFCSPHIGHO2_01_FULL_45_18 TaxID=1817823 RepID=A0A1F5NSB1_9BACT|nr:MAG: hypothetical protein A2660_01490 [Candidatus Doudnabacteria bacterium RIFCSPHIGHO2_01_FULL_45_18]